MAGAPLALATHHHASAISPAAPPHNHKLNQTLSIDSNPRTPTLKAGTTPSRHSNTATVCAISANVPRLASRLMLILEIRFACPFLASSLQPSAPLSTPIPSVRSFLPSPRLISTRPSLSCLDDRRSLPPAELADDGRGHAAAGRDGVGNGSRITSGNEPNHGPE